MESEFILSQAKNLKSAVDTNSKQVQSKCITVEVRVGTRHLAYSRAIRVILTMLAL